jgi:hypothetical protein
VADACRLAGLPTGARLLRHFANAVYLLDEVPVVVRVGSGPNMVGKATTAVAAVRWLAARDFPVTELAALPSGVEQPLVLDRAAAPVVVTFWRFYPQPARAGWPGTDLLGRTAAGLHAVPAPPPIELPVYQPLRSVSAAATDPSARLAMEPAQREWLVERIDTLRAAFANLNFPLGSGLIHGDMYNGNLLWAGDRGGRRHPVVLGDWDSVAIGPREVDLIPTYAEPRFGVPAVSVDAFARAYGHDLRGWSGYEVLYDIRELSTLTALIRLGPTDERLKGELSHRLHLLIRGDRTTRWNGQ